MVQIAKESHAPNPKVVTLEKKSKSK